MFFYVFFTLCLIYWCGNIFMADLRRRIIPDVHLFPLLLLGLVVVHTIPWVCTPTESIIGACCGYIIPTITGLIFDKIKPNSKYPSIGMGDIKLITCGGIWLGTIGLVIAILIASITGLIWGKYKKEKYIPFGPFFIIGGFLSFLIIKFLL
ncbi:MAG: prepilin peptidase [Alphaproteobacteria bacterium]